MSEAWAAHRSGDSDRAEQILDGIIRAHPQAVPAVVASGIVAGSRGQSHHAKLRMEAALKLDPKCLPALHWLSMLALEAGLGEDAIAYAEREVQFAPRDATAYADLARGYVAQDRYEQASACYRRAIALNPHQPTLYCEHSAVLENLARDGEAAQSLRVALQLDPNSSWILRLAEFELREGRTQEALNLCRRALSLNPDIAETHMLLAEILEDAQQGDEAAHHWQRAAQLEPNKGLVTFKRAESLRLLGRFDEAIAEYRKAVELDPYLGRAYYSLVASKKVTAEEMPLITAMEKALTSESLPDKDRINLLYALAKSSDNLCDYERAIGYYDQANLINKTRFLRHISFDREQFKAHIDATIAIFTKEFLKENLGKGLRSDLPILVVGMMRSGTTLTEQILSCHRDVGGAGEQLFWPDRESQIVDSVHRQVNYEAVQPNAQAYVDLLKSLTPGFPRIVDKNPANAFTAGLINLALPDARILHVRRKPIDTALSIWMTPMRTSAPFVADRSNIVFAFKEHLRLMEHWRSAIPEERFLDVRYEELVSNPEPNVSSILDFCGLDWDAACLRPEDNERVVRTPSFWQVRQPIYQSSSERWRRYEPWLNEFEDLLELD
jgi:tetratricopeptide (TPR) repeat protein